MSPSPPRRPIATLPSPGCGFARGACSWAAGAQIRSGARLSAGGAGPLPFPKANRSGWVLTRPSVESCGQLARQHQPADQRTQKRLSLAQSLRINTLFPPVIDCLVLCMWKAAALRTSCKGRGTMCPEGPSPSDRGVYHISPSYSRTFLSEAECVWRTTNAGAAVTAGASAPLRSPLPGCGFARGVHHGNEGPVRRWRAGLSIPSGPDLQRVR